MPTEPCPFCGARVVPMMIGDVKICPSCGGRWIESGGGIRSGEDTPPSAGGGAEVAVAC